MMNTDTEYTVGKVFTDKKSGIQYDIKYIKTFCSDRAYKLKDKIAKIIKMNNENAYSYIAVDSNVHCDVCGVDYDAESPCEFH
tara:strand:- start:655 stop:903 length:249 start_codon:yes stop_codon:yes gene_type:complete